LPKIEYYGIIISNSNMVAKARNIKDSP